MRLSAPIFAIVGLSLVTLQGHAYTFTPGEFVTHSQEEYGTFERIGEPFDPAVAALVESNFDTLFAPFEDLLQVGIPGPAGFSMIFDSADAVIAYLPAGGNPGPLTADLLDPIFSASGVLGGEVVTATLNLALSNAGLLAHPAGEALGDLVFQNLEALIGSPFFTGLDPDIAKLDGLPIHEVLSEANLLIGGYASQVSASDLEAALYTANEAFWDGLLPTDTFVNGDVYTPSAYLVAPPSSAPAAPEPSTWAMLLIGFAGLGFAHYRLVKGREPPRARLAGPGGRAPTMEFRHDQP